MSKQEMDWMVEKMTRSVGFLIMEVIMPALWVCQKMETAFLGAHGVVWLNDNLPRMPMSLPLDNGMKMDAVRCSNNIAEELLKVILPGYEAWVSRAFLLSGCEDMVELHSQSRANPETQRPLKCLILQAAKTLWLHRRRMYEGEDDIWDLLRFKDFKATVLGHFMKEAIWMLMDLTVDLLPKGKRSAAADRLSYPKVLWNICVAIWFVIYLLF